jgi:carboxyl-terminal processing protease
MIRRLQYAVVASSTAIVILLLFGAVHGRSAAADNNPYTQLGVYSEVLSRIKNDYVEEPDIKAVTLGAINGMLESVDPFASYLNADQYKQYQRAKQNPKSGVGLILARRLGYIGVLDAIPGSPAAKAGLSTGDVIESINNVATHDMPLAFAEILLQGDPGTQVEMSVLRLRSQDPQKVVLVRGAVAHPPLTSRLITEGTPEPAAYIATSTLEGSRVREIASKIEELEKQGAKKVILDVRYCGEGTPQEGIALANLFMDRGLITYLQGQKVSRQDFQAAPGRAVTHLPLVVLTNRGTAGGAEIAAAALLDAKRAELVGERTYGDAGQRKAVTLDDGSAVILSVAKYYSPSGKSIQDNGVTPTIAQAEPEPPSADDDDQDAAPPPAPDAGKAGEDPILKKGLATQPKL